MNVFQPLFIVCNKNQIETILEILKKFQSKFLKLHYFLFKFFQVAPIIAKCHDSISSAMNNIQAEKDSAIVIEKFKSGDVPPGDFNFEDMQDPHSMLTADALANTGPSNLNLYPRKKELERQMARIEAELSKSQKELFSLNQMMETYQNNPKFGNSKKFQSEIQNLHSHVSELESALTSIRAEHVQVEERLGALRARTSSPNIRLSPTARLQRGGNAIRILTYFSKCTFLFLYAS